MEHYTIRVSGRVQGVNFRASTKSKAEELGVNGWVCNEPDGTVLIEAEASNATLQDFLDWCGKGPPAAKVENLVYDKKVPEGFQGFSVK